MVRGQGLKGLKPAFIVAFYAALKRRSSTVLQAVLMADCVTGAVGTQKAGSSASPRNDDLENTLKAISTSPRLSLRVLV